MTARTDLYIATVVRRLPEGSRDDIAEEIRATIDDMIDARLGEEDPPKERLERVEREVLEELGDPAVLAGRYSNSPQFLIGPASYPVFLWCMRTILPITGVAALLINVVAHSLTTPEVQIGSLIGAVIGKTVLALLLCFAAVTILLALGERGPGPETRSPRAPGESWSVDDLRATDPDIARTRAEALLGLVMIVLLAIVPFLPTTLFYAGHLNDGGSFVNPGLGSGWIVSYWTLLGLMAAVEAIRALRGSTPRALMIAGSVIDVVMGVFLTIALLTQTVFHPELMSPSGVDVTQIVAVVAVWIVVIWDQIDTWRGQRPAARTVELRQSAG
ncbi:hypothetical protein DFO66_101285 [Brevibacterium sanguinis]|uniref:Uncharacterized protein n=2 Tax=Brevibacterium TaxID=1696 RepID=A0A366IN84_9MICO|nr:MULTISPECIES: hypothetical protein [Brevibacterium]RBP68058.1 hypothetical protein DFO66_101285 [Brevibacterium sanguinis]RBP74525.1 hypothetical protein DFO65_101244 [Brevibacterium celere]